MRSWTPLTRTFVFSIGISFSLFVSILWGWVFLRFVHRDTQNHLLAPEYYDLEVVTAEDYQKLSDPANADREVTLSDGTRIVKAPVWDKAILPNFKPSRDGQHYVLVMTGGTAHCLAYVEHDYILFALLAAWGLVLSVWNQKLLQRDLRAAEQPRAETEPGRPGDRST